MGCNVVHTEKEEQMFPELRGEYLFYTSSHIMAMIDPDEKLTYQKGKDDFIKSYKHPGMGRNDIYWVSADKIETYKK